MNNFKDLLKNVKGFVFDIDGVFASNVIVMLDSELMRTMNTKDGFILSYASKLGFPIAIITGGVQTGIRERFQMLGAKEVYISSKDKVVDLLDFCAKYEIAPQEILYMGDDIPDYFIMQKVGIPTCPADAADEIKAISLYVSDKKGGEGCVRDVIVQVLRSQEKWNF